MKQFLKGVMEWKASACFLYTGAMFLYLLFSTVFHNDEISLTMLWTMFLVSVLATLILTAWQADWFPMDQAGAWAMFIGIFFLIFIAMTIGFDIYFRITGRKYDGMLGQYRKQKEEKSE